MGGCPPGARSRASPPCSAAVAAGGSGTYGSATSASAAIRSSPAPPYAFAPPAQDAIYCEDRSAATRRTPLGGSGALGAPQHRLPRQGEQCQHQLLLTLLLRLLLRAHGASPLCPRTQVCLAGAVRAAAAAALERTARVERRWKAVSKTAETAVAEGRWAPPQPRASLLQAHAAATAHLAVAEAVLEARMRAVRAQRRWQGVAAAAETAVVEGRWAPPQQRWKQSKSSSSPPTRPLTDLEEIIRSADLLADEVKVGRQCLGNGALVHDPHCRVAPCVIVQALEAAQRRRRRRENKPHEREHHREMDRERPEHPNPRPSSARAYARDLNVNELLHRPYHAFQTAVEDEEIDSPPLSPPAAPPPQQLPSQQQTSPMWRPTGQAGRVQPQLRLPGWTAKERRLRAKLGGPAEEQGAAAAAAVSMKAHAALPHPSDAPILAIAPWDAAVGQLSQSLPAEEPWVNASPLRMLQLRFVAPTSSGSSQLFGDPAVALPATLASPARLLGTCMPAIAVSRVPSHQLSHMGRTMRTAGGMRVGSPASRSASPPAAAAGPLHFKFDLSPMGDIQPDGHASRGTRDIIRTTRSRRIAPSSVSPTQRALAPTPAASQVTSGPALSPEGHFSAPAPFRGAGRDAGSMEEGGGHLRVWSRGLAWLNDAASEAEATLPMPGSVTASSQMQQQLSPAFASRVASGGSGGASDPLFREQGRPALLGLPASAMSASLPLAASPKVSPLTSVRDLANQL